MLQSTLERVVDCLVTTTRYPRELLTPDAELENGLGIDSVKRMELLLALGEEFSIDLQTQQYDPALRTIDELANWLDSLLSKDSAPPEAAPPRARDQRTDSNQNGHAHNRISSPHTLPTPHYPREDRGTDHHTGKPLSGRVALVTGSGRGVGRTIARMLAERGAMVIVNSFHSRESGEQTVAEINASGGSAVHIWGSVANPAHVDEMFNEIQQRFGLDILICNASDGRIGSFLDLNTEDWDRAFRTNVAGHHQCAVRAAQIMRPRGGGSIVTMSAVGAHQHIDGLGSQGVVKAAVESMTRYLAFALGGSGIRVNCVAGGPVYGELLDSWPAAQEAQKHWESMTPDGELCTPMDLAQTIGFLLSDEARAINGAVWMVDHGFSATAEGQRRQRGSTNPMSFAHSQSGGKS